MPDYRAQYAASAWLLTRELIGQELRTRYDFPTELPPRLCALSRQLGSLETGRLPEASAMPLHTLVRKLDALEGDQLLRRCNERLRDLPRMDIGALT
jgi:hypothetical protein